MIKHTVAMPGELSEGQCKLVRVDGVEIGLFLVDGGYRAYRNFCPHAGAPLCAARAGGFLSGGATYEPGGEPGSVRCPWHGWEFDLRTGAFLRNPRCTLDAYRVEVADGAVSVWV